MNPMNADMAEVFQFVDGATIHRLLSKSAFRKYLGAPEMPDEVAGFVLMIDGEIRSGGWEHTGEGVLSNQLRPPIGDSSMGKPTDPGGSPYWREFVEQTHSFEMADKTFARPILMPASISKVIEKVEREEGDKFQALSDIHTEADDGESYIHAKRELSQHMLHVLRRIFDPLGPFRSYVRVLRINHLPGHFTSSDQILLQLLQVPDGEGHSFEVSESSKRIGWWEIREQHPYPVAGRYRLEADGSLQYAWTQLAEQSARHLRPFVDPADLDAWWATQRIEGGCPYDLEPYFLLGAGSPIWFDNPSFTTWIAQQRLP